MVVANGSTGVPERRVCSVVWLRRDGGRGSCVEKRVVFDKYIIKLASISGVKVSTEREKLHSVIFALKRKVFGGQISSRFGGHISENIYLAIVFINGFQLRKDPSVVKDCFLALSAGKLEVIVLSDFISSFCGVKR